MAKKIAQVAAKTASSNDVDMKEGPETEEKQETVKSQDEIDNLTVEGIGWIFVCLLLLFSILQTLNDPPERYTGYENEWKKWLILSGYILVSILDCIFAGLFFTCDSFLLTSFFV